jgi:hypothetical protein
MDCCVCAGGIWACCDEAGPWAGRLLLTKRPRKRRERENMSAGVQTERMDSGILRVGTLATHLPAQTVAYPKGWACWLGHTA